MRARLAGLGDAPRRGLSHDTIHRIWRTFGLPPHRGESCQLSTDPEFVDKVRDVVGLYLNPPDHVLVLCVDEKSPCQARERTQPMRPLGPGRAERQTTDYCRHGTVSRFAALDGQTGHIIGRVQARHPQRPFLQCLRDINAATSADLDLHLVLDNYATHKTPAGRRWLTRHPRIHLHFIPTHSSWLNQSERWFAKITNHAIRRGSFRSVQHLRQTIGHYIAANNQDPKPFVWTASASLILGKVSHLGRCLVNGGLGFQPDEDAGETDHGRKGDVKFFVAGGDATIDLEPSEEILDPVTLAVEMLVKVRFDCTIGLWGYDGDAAELVHISAEGIPCP